MLEGREKRKLRKCVMRRFAKNRGNVYIYTFGNRGNVESTLLHNSI